MTFEPHPREFFAARPRAGAHRQPARQARRAGRPRHRPRVRQHFNRALRRTDAAGVHRACWSTAATCAGCWSATTSASARAAPATSRCCGSRRPQYGFEVEQLPTVVRGRAAHLEFRGARRAARGRPRRVPPPARPSVRISGRVLHGRKLGRDTRVPDAQPRGSRTAILRSKASSRCACTASAARRGRASPAWACGRRSKTAAAGCSKSICSTSTSSVYGRLVCVEFVAAAARRGSAIRPLEAAAARDRRRRSAGARAARRLSRAADAMSRQSRFAGRSTRPARTTSCASPPHDIRATPLAEPEGAKECHMADADKSRRRAPRRSRRVRSERRSRKYPLNLPDTPFPMRGDLAKREPRWVARWDGQRIYHQIRAASRRSPEVRSCTTARRTRTATSTSATAVNKILKDIVVKSRARWRASTRTTCRAGTATACRSRSRSRRSTARTCRPREVQAKARALRHRADRTQMKDFKRLGVLGDWDNPYMTMNFSTEADEIRALGEDHGNGFRLPRPQARQLVLRLRLGAGRSRGRIPGQASTPRRRRLPARATRRGKLAARLRPADAADEAGRGGDLDHDAVDDPGQPGAQRAPRVQLRAGRPTATAGLLLSLPSDLRRGLLERYGLEGTVVATLARRRSSSSVRFRIRFASRSVLRPRCRRSTSATT